MFSDEGRPPGFHATAAARASKRQLDAQVPLAIARVPAPGEGDAHAPLARRASADCEEPQPVAARKRHSGVRTGRHLLTAVQATRRIRRVHAWCMPPEAMMNKDPVTTVGARAIDVGYFNVKYTLGRKATGDHSGVATGLFPALAPMLKTGSVRSLADAPAADGCMVSVGSIGYFVGAGAVHHGKGIEPRSIDADYSSSDKYLALLRGALFYMATDAAAGSALAIDYLVLGLPLTTYYSHHQQLLQRALGEHVVSRPGGEGECRVTVRDGRVIVQPAGALVNFGVRTGRMPDGFCLVIDVGGGTLDWYVTSGLVPNLERSGAYPRAMLECAYAVADKINSRWRHQFAIVDRIDRAIRERAPSFTVQGTEHRLAEYGDVVDKVLEESVNQMLATVGALDDIDHVLLTGGGARVLGEHLLRRLPQLRPVIKLDPDPVYSNVRGFQVIAEHYAQAAAARA